MPIHLPDRQRVRRSVLDAADVLLDLQRRQPYAPADNYWAWGSTSQSLNNLVVVATAHDLTGLVDTSSTPTPLRLAQGRQVDAGRFVTHRFTLDQFDEAYDVFARAGDTGALKVVLTRS